MHTGISRLVRKEEGFTLIELLVVVAIIALLTAFAVPKLFDAITKAKKAPGQADMQTLTAAMERYFMDNNTYPYGANAGVIQTALTNGYVKNNTTFKNGWAKGYIYITDASGGYYILIDAGNEPTATDLTVTCNAKIQTPVHTGATGLTLVTSATITATDVAAGDCAVTGSTGTNTPTLLTN